MLRTPLTLPFLLFLAWVTATAPFAIDPGNTFHDIYSHLIRYIVLYLIIFNYFNNRAKVIHLTWVFVLSSTIFIGWAMIYFYLMLDNPITTRLATGHMEVLKQAPIATIGFVAFVSLLVSLHLFFETAELRLKTLLAVFITLLGSSLFLSQTRGFLIALFISIIVLTFPRNKKIMIALLLLLIGLTVFTRVGDRFTLNPLLHNARTKICFTMLEISKDYPLTGIGYGMQSYYSLDAEKYDKRIKDPRKKHLYGPDKRLFIGDPHNWAAGLLVRTGIPGLILYLYLIFAILKMGLETIIRQPDRHLKVWGLCFFSCCIGFLIAGLFEPSFFHMSEVIFYSFLAMMTVIWRLTTSHHSHDLSVSSS